MDKERDAHREFSFLFIPFISVRCSALLLVVISANRFDIRAVMVLDDYFMRLVKSLPPTILALLLTGMIFIPVPQLQAGGSNKNGNPYGNGSFFPNNGTFSGVIRGENLGGITQFSTSVTNALSTSRGAAFLYINGFSYSSGVAAVLDPASSSLNAYFSTAAETNGGTNILGGGFLGSLQNSYPNQTFTGNGFVTVVDLVIDPTGDTLNRVPISVNGVRISN
jgi:hypothetical protein